MARGEEIKFVKYWEKCIADEMRLSPKRPALFPRLFAAFLRLMCLNPFFIRAPGKTAPEEAKPRELKAVMTIEEWAYFFSMARYRSENRLMGETQNQKSEKRDDVESELDMCLHPQAEKSPSECS